MEESKSNVNLARVYPESFILHLALLNCMRSPFCTYIQATKLPRLIRFVFFLPQVSDGVINFEA